VLAGERRLEHDVAAGVPVAVRQVEDRGVEAVGRGGERLVERAQLAAQRAGKGRELDVREADAVLPELTCEALEVGRPALCEIAE
jgi:hypothetical protein